MRETDTQPPLLEKLSASVHVEDDQEGGGCGAGAKCGPPNAITIGPAATDDISLPHDIGYRITATDGSVPLGLVGIGSAMLYPVLDGKVVLYWGEAGDQPFDFVVSVVAIDRAGNESTEQLVRIKGGDSGGCSVALGSRLPAVASLMTFAVLATAMAMTRRRFRSRG